jgi:hypothetical protein
MKKLRDLKKGWALILALVLTVTFTGPSYAAGTGNGGDGDQVAAQPVTNKKNPKPEVHKVEICHATSSDKNPYSSNKVSWSSIDNENNVNWNGHGDHDRDIIPVFGDFPGQNLGIIDGLEGVTGDAILANGCEVPEQPKDKVTPDLPTVVDECGTANDGYTLPSNSDSITYSFSDGYAYAKITVDNTEWDSVPHAWKKAGDGMLKLKIKFTDEPCVPEQPADELDVTKVLGQFQCDSMTVDVATTTITTPYKLNKAGTKWVLDSENATIVKSTEARALTDEEAATCPPQNVTEWVMWTIPDPGCANASQLNMGLENAGSTKGWQNCNEHPFDQTNPNVMTQKELNAFDPACGTWFQVDQYKGTQDQIDAVLEDGLLTINGGVVEDHSIVKKWFYLQGEDCAPDAITEWHTWQVPVDCKDTLALDSDMKSALGVPSTDCSTPRENIFDQPYVGPGQLVPPCGVWYQVDNYTGPPDEIAALWSDGVLKMNEDSSLLIRNDGVGQWYFIYGGDCAVPVTPAPPTVVDVCGIDNNDTFTLPVADGIKYKFTKNYLVAQIRNSDANVWGEMPAGWVVAKNGNAKLKLADFHTDSNQRCVIPTPPRPDFVDPCGLDNWAVTVPADTADVTWSAVKDNIELNGKVGVTATATAGNVFDNGNTTKSYAWSNVDSLLCSVPVPPTVVDSCGTANDVVVLPETEGVVYSQKVAPSGDIRVKAVPAQGYEFADGVGSAKDNNVKWYTVTVGAGSDFQLDTRDCIIDTPLRPEFVDPCGLDNWAVTVPADTEKVMWGAVQNHIEFNGKVGVTATATAGYVFDNGNATKSYAWSNVDSVLCLVPAPPVVVEMCGVDNNDTFTLPVTDGIEYSFTEDYLVAHITDPKVNTWGDLPEGWVAADNGDANLSLADFHTDSNQRCVIPTPPRPDFVDPCGLDNWAVTVPADTADVTWSAVQNHIELNGKVGVNATATAGNVFDNGNTTKSYAWINFDSVLCPVPVPPTVVEEVLGAPPLNEAPLVKPVKSIDRVLGAAPLKEAPAATAVVAEASFAG